MDQAVRLQYEDFSHDAEIAKLKAQSTGIGGITTFLGCVRDFSDAHAVCEISFDAYERMVLPELSKIHEEAMRRFNLIAGSIIHRIGTLQAGDNIVFVAAAATHRPAAFEGCRWMIDTLKERVPLWKKEISPTGEAWVTPHP